MYEFVEGHSEEGWKPSDGMRLPVRDSYDAIVDLAGDDESGPFAYSLLKFNFSMDGRATRLPANPLEHDFRDEHAKPCLHPGTDFWPTKVATDVVVQGRAYAPRGNSVPSMVASLEMGSIKKQVKVFGNRTLRWSNGRLVVSEPEPFTSVALDYSNAYGGIDDRVARGDVDDPIVRFRLLSDHPGLYPRNPLGKGYWVLPGERDEVGMPSLENPLDLLTPERLLIREPELWFRGPLPWCLDWTPLMSFPRFIFTGVEPWFPVPDSESLLEVGLGLLPPDYRSSFSSESLEAIDLRFRQGGGSGQVLPFVKAGTPFHLYGMHPEQSKQSFVLPEPPSVQFTIDGKTSVAEPKVHSIVCYPDEERFTVVYGAMHPLPRAMIPGLHKHIPVSVRVNQDAPIYYEAPPTIRERKDAAEARKSATL